MVQFVDINSVCKLSIAINEALHYYLRNVHGPNSMQKLDQYRVEAKIVHKILTCVVATNRIDTSVTPKLSTYL